MNSQEFVKNFNHKFLTGKPQLTSSLRRRVLNTQNKWFSRGKKTSEDMSNYGAQVLMRNSVKWKIYGECSDGFLQFVKNIAGHIWASRQTNYNTKRKEKDIVTSLTEIKQLLPLLAPNDEVNLYSVASGVHYF